MSDSIPTITDVEAAGEIADVFADIRNVYRVGVVNLVWRHLATFPGALPWVWGSVRPLYIDGTIERMAAALRMSIPLSELPIFPTAVLAAAGLTRHDIERIQAVLAAYNRTNAMALVALSAVRRKIGRNTETEDVVGAAAPYTRSSVGFGPEIRMPPLLDLADLSPETAELVLAMNRLGARHDASVVASMYRHLAHWPAYLALAWTVLAPLDADNRLEHAISDVMARAHASAGEVATHLGTPGFDVASEVRAGMSHALDRFIGNVIARMVVIGAFLGRATG
jgi:hypothetical protein